MKRILWFLVLSFWLLVSLTFAQEDTLEFNIDASAKTTALSKIFSPGIDLSGRGYHREMSWPYNIAAKEVLEKWQNEISFKGIFRLYWNIWEMEQVKLDEPLKKALFSNYENIIKNISDSGGIVILSLFGTPPGMGEALDKRSAPLNIKQWKSLVKNTMRYFSCDKKYHIWYEVWSAPDTEDFFLGTKRDYLNLYQAVAEAARELKKEKKINIFVGGPSVTWWFQNFDGNSIVTAEQSLIYELIKFCSKRRLPLDFMSWHAYSTDPQAEKEATTYNKTLSRLIRDWLKYFRLDQNIPLIIDEWNFDTGLNMAEERGEESFIAASFIPARLKNMSEAGIDYQLYFSLEDFQDNELGINANRGAFSYEPKSLDYSSKAKAIYNAFLMLNSLGEKLFSTDISDEFVGALATKRKEDLVLLIWNYVDPLLARNYISRNIALLSEKCRVDLLGLFKSGQLDKVLQGEISLEGLTLTDKLKALLKKAIELNQKAQFFKDKSRNIKINLSNIKGNYLYQRYSINGSCAFDCPFSPLEEKEISIDQVYQETLALSPYSIELIILKVKPSQN